MSGSDNLRLRPRYITSCHTSIICTQQRRGITNTCILYILCIYPTIMQGFSVCLFANFSFSLHAIEVKLSNPSQRHLWSVLRGLAFCFRSFFYRIQTKPYYPTYLKGAIFITRLPTNTPVEWVIHLVTYDDGWMDQMDRYYVFLRRTTTMNLYCNLCCARKKWLISKCRKLENRLEFKRNSLDGHNNFREGSYKPKKDI